jgi:P4 family phage/plasmid primase-like protien
VHHLNPDTGRPVAAVPPDVVRFLNALLAPEDWLLIRPIETWTENGRKRSRVVYDGIRHYRAKYLTGNPLLWSRVVEGAAAERANVFFGVCPRFDSRQRYDLAWQIRVVRALWADLDHCTVEEALKRCEREGLPRPSIIVRSAHGVHLYWLLAEPFPIDDVGDPPAVLKEWPEAAGPGEKKRPRQYIEGPAGKTYRYLTDPKTGRENKRESQEWPGLSLKAQHVQDVLAGLAAKVGGDHTQDLARLLRLPCTLNRKDERTGKPPVPCELVECNSERRYPFADFERFAEHSPERAEAKELAKVRLKTGTRLTDLRRNDLGSYVNACAVAPVGSRSGYDYALCCYALRKGFDKEVIWAEVEGVGKFADRGRDYFDRTWGKAEKEVRREVYERTCRRVGARPAAGPGGAAQAPEMNGAPQVHGGPADSPEGGDDVGLPSEAIDNPHRLARIYLATRAQSPDGLLLRYYREQCWRWRRPRWQADPDAETRARLASFCAEQLARDNAEVVAGWTGEGPPPDVPKVTTAMVSNVLQALAGETLVPQDTPQPAWLGDGPPDRNYLVMANGILDVDALLAGGADVLVAHTPLWFSPVALPYDFNPAADCPRWRAFLARNLAGDPGKIGLLQQVAGYLLLPDTSLQRFLMMAGEGANGKSVVCAVLRALLGEDNVSSVPLELFGDKFRLAGTLGKLANIIAEVGELDKMAEGQLKAFVTGDPIEFERKFKSPFTAKPTARLVLATNNPPQFSDKSDGLWRRMLLLHFTVQIPEAERVAGMDKVEFWQASGELPGILNWALAGLHSLRAAGRFVVPPKCQEDADRLRADSNPARRFLLEHYQAGTGFVATAKLYAAYAEWCKQHGHYAQADVGFGREVARCFPTAKRDKKTIDGARCWAYCGLDLRRE